MVSLAGEPLLYISQVKTPGTPTARARQAHGVLASRKLSNCYTNPSLHRHCHLSDRPASFCPAASASRVPSAACTAFCDGLESRLAPSIPAVDHTHARRTYAPTPSAAVSPVCTCPLTRLAGFETAPREGRLPPTPTGRLSTAGAGASKL